MLNLKKRIPLPPESDPMDVVLPPMVTSTLPGSHDVNLALMVRDHAPRRITDIEREVKDLENRIVKLNDERDTLNRLIAALDG